MRLGLSKRVEWIGVFWLEEQEGSVTGRSETMEVTWLITLGRRQRQTTRHPSVKSSPRVRLLGCLEGRRVVHDIQMLTLREEPSLSGQAVLTDLDLDLASREPDLGTSASLDPFQHAGVLQLILSLLL